MSDKLHSSTLKLPCAAEEVDLFLSEPTEKVKQAIKRTPGEFMVLGAAGKMGLHVCLMIRKSLDELSDSRRVIAVSRFSRPEARKEFEQMGVETVQCDLSSPEELDSLESVDNIIFMAGAKFGTADRPELLTRMNVEMPKLVANRFRNCRITAFSTGCVYPYFPTDSTGPDELVETKPIGAYAQSCVGRELAFLDAARQHGTRIALIRLNYSVEFRYGVPVDIVTNLMQKKTINLSMGHANIIWQRDAVAYSLLAHELSSSDGFILNVTRPEVVRIRDLANRLGELLSIQPQFVGEEETTAWISNPAKSIQLFGEAETDVDTILQYVAAWAANNLPTLQKPTGFEKRDGKF